MQSENLNLYLGNCVPIEGSFNWLLNQAIRWDGSVWRADIITMADDTDYVIITVRDESSIRGYRTIWYNWEKDACLKVIPASSYSGAQENHRTAVRHAKNSPVNCRTWEQWCKCSDLREQQMAHLNV